MSSEKLTHFIVANNEITRQKRLKTQYVFGMAVYTLNAVKDEGFVKCEEEKITSGT